MSKQFTVITKDGSKWLSLPAPHGVDPIQWHSDNLDLPYIGNRPEATILDESEVKEVEQYRQKDNENVDWKLWTTGVIDWDCVIETRTVYRDAEPHDHDISDDYWRKRCEAAERYIQELHVLQKDIHAMCDDSVVPEEEWQEIVKQQPK